MTVTLNYKLAGIQYELDVNNFIGSACKYNVGGVHRVVQKTVDYNFFTHFVYIYNPIFGVNQHLQRMMKIYNLQHKIP